MNRPGPADHDVVIVGAGFSGLYQLKRLRDDGWSVRLVEAGAGLGGVWHHNRYPGARVDSHVPNYEYSHPEVWQDWNWTERFPGRDELVAYFDHVDRVWGLSPDIDLNTRVTAARFDSEQNLWDISTDGGQGHYRCRYLIMCTGFGSKPFVPDLPGLDHFDGPCHHTARWPEEGVELAGHRVGIIGTGASGVQVTQEAANEATHVTVFQRSPVMAIPMQQRRLDPDQQRRAKADYPEVFRLRNNPPGSFADIRRLDAGALEYDEAARNDVYQQAWERGGFHFWTGTFSDILLDEQANRTAYDFWRDKVRDRVDDPAVAEALAPTDPPYPFGTKRPSLEQTYYDCFNQTNVTLVDLKATPIERIAPTGIDLASAEPGPGRHVELDVLVLATGFDANTGGLTAVDIRGSDDRSLADTWADGVDTHLGVAVHGFPNLAFLYGPQSSTAFCNGPVCAEKQGDWMADFLDRLRRDGKERFEPSADTGPAWTAHLAELADSTLFGKADSWYMGANIPGKRRQLLNYPSSDGYLGRLQRCAEADYSGFELA
jgi:cyclohexanone monooxygenase